MSDLRQSTEYARFMEKIGWTVERFDCCQIFIRRLSFLGSIIKIQRPEKIPFEEIDRLAKKHKALLVIIEPNKTQNGEELIQHGFKKSQSPYLCSKTIKVDLSPSEEEILAQMKKDARYELRKIQKESLSARGGSGSAGQLIELEDLHLFREAWKKSASWQRWIPPENYLTSLKEAFGEKAIFLVASLNEEVLAGTLILIADKIAYYYFAFSSKEGKKMGVPYFLVWEAMKRAREKGCRIFDFEGIYDERFRQTKSWRGFTHFKKSFGGKEVEYPGPFIKFYNPFIAMLRRLI